ncbi:MAG: M23 family metallopeptidase [Patescibacteria group bacterium]
MPRPIGIVLLSLIILASASAGWFLYAQRLETTSLLATQTPTISSSPVAEPEPLSMQAVHLADLENADDHFRLTVEIPVDWQAIVIPESKAVALYDPAAVGSTPLEKSQIFLRYFEAERFLTLTTVDVFERTELTLHDRAAVRYRIKKKGSVANFPNQPGWRNGEHEVTDIRESTDNPSVFYVIARNPALPVEQFNKIVDSLQFDADEKPATAIGEPVEGFVERVTLKPFGILINGDTSPVQPERFSGYHTAADAEFTSDADRDREISVRAVLEGTVVTSKTASGYGGVMVVKHELDGKQVFGIYGHVKPSSMLDVGTIVVRGQQVAVLGAAGTSETDGERKHLHFGLYVGGSSPSLAGYVSTKAALESWLDPLPLINP